MSAFLVINLMVFVIIMIMARPGSDLVMVVAPFDQRNVALRVHLNRGAWRTVVHGVTKQRTGLSD